MSDEKITEMERAEPNNKKSFSWLNIGILCSAFAVIVLIFMAGYGFWYLLSANMSLATVAKQSQNQVQQLQSDLNALKSDIDSTQQTMQQSIDDIKNLKQTVSNLPQLKQDNQTKEFQDYISSIYLKLVALGVQLDQLPLQQITQTSQSNAVIDQNQTRWQRGLQIIWKALQNIIIVRHHSDGLMPLITAEQQSLFYQNLHAILAQSIWALLYKQPEVYQSSLQQLVTQIKRYFVLDAPLTRSVLNDLMQLEKVNVKPIGV